MRFFRCAGYVTRRDPHREANAKLALVVAQAFLILNFDADLFLRADIGEGRGENICTLLLDERGFLALLFGDFIGFARAVAFFDLTFDHALTHFHVEMIQGALFWQREDVYTFHPLG